MTNKKYTLDEFEEYSKLIIELVENVMTTHEEHEEQYTFSKLYHKLIDINIGIEVIKKAEKERNKKEFNLDYFEEYYKVPTEFIRNIKNKYADDKNLIDFCDKVLADLEDIDIIQQDLRGKYDK